MKFCSNCGSPVSLRVPDGDNRQRHVCGACNVIHYQNPRIIVGCIVESGDQVLLCRRGIEPRRGMWTAPAGFLENGETTFEGAIRETLEEANARVEIGAMQSLYNVPHISQVHMLFRARLTDPHVSAGVETLEVRLFREDEIPWDEIAFTSVRNALAHYFEDRRRGKFEFHTGTVEPSGRR